MNNFWKGVASVLALQWLLGNKRDGRWGCGGCLTYLITIKEEYVSVDTYSSFFDE